MHFALLFSLLTFAGISTAITLPKLPDIRPADGFYLAHLDENGQSIHTLIAAPNNTDFIDGVAPSMPKPRIAKRSSGYCWCGCGYYVNKAGTDAANADLANQIGNGVTVREQNCYYSIRGGIVAFVCNPYPTNAGATFFKSNVGGCDAVITADCGLYVAGTYAWGYETSYLVGYMNWYSGLDFLTASIAGTAKGC